MTERGKIGPTLKDAPLAFLAIGYVLVEAAAKKAYDSIRIVLTRPSVLNHDHRECVGKTGNWFRRN